MYTINTILICTTEEEDDSNVFHAINHADG